MKRMLAALGLFAAAVPAGAVSFVIDGTHGGDVLFDSFDWEIAFTTRTSAAAAPAAFTVDFSGFITADARFCSEFPPEEAPADCTDPIDPISAQESYVAERGTGGASLFLPFGASATANGWMHFSNTDGGRVRITMAGGTLLDAGSSSGLANALPVPEPSSWIAMVLGMGMIGGVARWRQRFGLRPA